MSLPCRKNIPELIHYPRKTNFFYTGDSSRRRNADAGAEGNPQDRRQLSCLSTSRGAAENPPGSFWKGSPGTCTRTAMPGTTRWRALPGADGGRIYAESLWVPCVGIHQFCEAFQFGPSWQGLLRPVARGRKENRTVAVKRATAGMP